MPRTQHLVATGHGTLSALTGGYQIAFAIGGVFALAGAAIGATFLRTRTAAADAPHLQPALESA